MRGSAVAAVDVGGTSIKAARIDTAGQRHDRASVPTPTGGEATVDAVAGIIAALRAEDPGIAAAGVVVPGIVDAARGIAVLSENLHWRDVPMRAMLAERTGLPVALDHDVRAAARAEHALGGEDDLAVLVIGTGIAAGIVIDGRMLDARGSAGEIGHSIVVPDGAACVCGSRGCLEAIASAGAIARRYADLVGSGGGGAAEVLRSAQHGDPLARAVWDEAVDALAIAVRQLVALTGVRTIAVAGGLSLAGEALIAPLRERVAERLSLQETPELRVAHVGADGGLIGAIGIAQALAAA